MMSARGPARGPSMTSLSAACCSRSASTIDRPMPQCTMMVRLVAMHQYSAAVSYDYSNPKLEDTPNAYSAAL